MIIARAFPFDSAGPDEIKNNEKITAAPPVMEDLKTAAIVCTQPVIITPSRRQPYASTAGRVPRRAGRTLSPSAIERDIPAHVASILQGTSIPVPRKGWGNRRQRHLPPTNHVEAFSKLLMEGVDPKQDIDLGSNQSSKNSMRLLLSPPSQDVADGSSHISSGSSDSGSPESVPSLDPDESPESPLLSPSRPATPPPDPKRGLNARPVRLMSESCTQDHPLMGSESSTSSEDLNGVAEPCFSIATARRPPKIASTFKSNLTASLRALKSAAQTVSTFTAPSIRNNDFFAHSLMTFSPELTDDKRPQPTGEMPSPQLRRYLNAVTPSAAHISVFHESPRTSLRQHHKATNIASVQLQTYPRSTDQSTRSGRRGPIPSPRLTSSTLDDHTSSIPISLPEPVEPVPPRQREIRENSDFLRVIVLEMNMRRRGKLRFDMPGRARIWLPPRKASATPRTPGECVVLSESGKVRECGRIDSLEKEKAAVGRKEKVVPQCWVAWSAEE